MTRKLDPIEKELNKIRRKIYEETKHMTYEQCNEYYSASTEEMLTEMGYKLVPAEGEPRSYHMVRDEESARWKQTDR